MKKLLLLITGLLLLFSVEGQILRYSNYTAPTPSDIYCTEFQAVYNAFNTKPHADTAAFMNAMVFSLDSAGYWDRMKVLYVFAVHEADDESLINWIDPDTYTATNNSSTTWTRYAGYTGDGTADYISTGWIPSKDSLPYALNSATLGVYCLNDVENGDPKAAISVGATNNSRIVVHTAGGNTLSTVNTAAPGFYAASTNSQGLFLATRRDHNVNETYRNGIHIADGTAESGLMPATEMVFLRFGTDYANNQVALGFAMDGITDTDAVNLNKIFQRYMRSIGNSYE